MSEVRQPIESGVPDPFPLMHPVLRKNYGNWKWHDMPRTGVLHHVAHSGDEIWTVKAAKTREMDSYVIHKLCDIADEYGEGYVRFTMRAALEIMVSDEKKVEPLIAKLEAEGFPVGGTGRSIKPISHTQGWLHCDIPGTDASGVVKALMDELFDDFKNEKLPNKLQITTSCCQINCGGQGDIAINVQQTAAPRINHDRVADVCERPVVISRCPVAAIRPALVNGKPSLEVDEKKCMYCGACYAPCPPMEINHPEYTKIAIWVGGKHASTRSKPTFHKLVATNLPNNPPRWPEVAEVVKNIIGAYRENAKDFERVGEWIERIGWPRFFKLTGLPFTKHHIDDWQGSRESLNASSQVYL